MSAANQILPFCPTNTGTNLESQADYLIDSNRTNGNQPGVASSMLNNKAIRQATYMAAGLGDAMVSINDMSVLDNNTSAQILAQMLATLERLPPKITTVTATGAGTYNLPYAFYIVTGSATVAATYSDGTTTYTVLATVASGTKIYMSGAARPTTGTGSGTLTKLSGTGDATLTYYAIRAPIRLYGEFRGGGGGGASSDVNDGVDGTDTTFGVITAGGGAKGIRAISTGAGGSGGTGSLGTGTTGIVLGGGKGDGAQSSAASVTVSGGKGGGAGGGGGGYQAAGTAGTASTGGGGGGASTSLGNAGAGGGEGCLVKGNFTDAFLLSTYAYVVGAGGSGGSAGAGAAGGAGGTGSLYLEAHFQ
jgi:hypothetical protein